MPESLNGEPRRSHYERVLQECLSAELRIVNTGLPRSQKRLSELLTEKHPAVMCNDGSTHLFKRSELDHLASILDASGREDLPLPILIEIGREEAGAFVICEGEAEEKVISTTLDMPVHRQESMIRIYKPQLEILRAKLKTTTAYIFSARAIS